MLYSPIAIFLFNRPNKTYNCLNSLSLNNGFKKSPLYIFIDGPKNKKDEIQISKIKRIIEEFNFENIEEVIISKFNIGLAKSIFYGVNRVLKNHETIIVLEDDLVVSKYFLDFMNNCLQKYKSENIYQISGYVWGDSIKKQTNFPYLVPNINSWGWATWKSKWINFELGKIKNENLNNFDRTTIYDFNLKNSYNYFKILKKHIRGKVDSWAIQWYYFVFINKGYTIYPHTSLVLNKGMDGSGTHTLSSKFNDRLDQEVNISYPKSLSFESNIFDMFCKDLKEANNETLFKKIILRALRFLEV